MNNDLSSAILIFSQRLKARISAWYLTHEKDFSCCETCGVFDNTKPNVETVYGLVNEELRASGVEPYTKENR